VLTVFTRGGPSGLAPESRRRSDPVDDNDDDMGLGGSDDGVDCAAVGEGDADAACEGEGATGNLSLRVPLMLPWVLTLAAGAAAAKLVCVGVGGGGDLLESSSAEPLLGACLFSS
jgi:hypothetical protein